MIKKILYTQIQIYKNYNKINENLAKIITK